MTTHGVTVLKDGEPQFDIEPHQSIKISTAEEYWIPDIKVVTDDGRTILEDHITWDEMRDMGSRIVIVDRPAFNGATPTPARSSTRAD